MSDGAAQNTAQIVGLDRAKACLLGQFSLVMYAALLLQHDCDEAMARIAVQGANESNLTAASRAKYLALAHRMALFEQVSKVHEKDDAAGRTEVSE